MAFSGEKFQIALEEAGLTIPELHAKLILAGREMSLSVLYQYARGHTPDPGFSKIRTIAGVLGKPPEFFFDTEA